MISFYKQKFRKSFSSGFSLIELLIATGIMSVVSIGLATLLQNQNTEIRAMQERMASIDFQTQAVRAFEDGSLCSSLVTMPGVTTFNSAAAAPSSKNHPSIKIPASQIMLSSTSTQVLAQANGLVSPLSSAMKFAAAPNAFVIDNISGSGDAYVGTFTFKVNPSTQVRAQLPISVTVQLATNPASPAGAKRVTACLIPPSPYKSCEVKTQSGGGNQYAYCDPGYTFVAGAGNCDSNNGPAWGSSSGPITNGWFFRCYFGAGVGGKAYANAFCCKQ